MVRIVPIIVAFILVTFTQPALACGQGRFHSVPSQVAEHWEVSIFPAAAIPMCGATLLETGKFNLVTGRHMEKALLEEVAKKLMEHPDPVSLRKIMVVTSEAPDISGVIQQWVARINGTRRKNRQFGSFVILTKGKK